MRYLSNRITTLGVIVFYMLLSGPKPLHSMSFSLLSETKKDAPQILEEIYREITELGKHPDDDYLIREFFVGEGDDDTYKDINVLVMIQDVDREEKMTIQVTYLERSKDNPTVWHAGKVRNISCLVERKRVAIIKSDYDEREIKSLLPEVLRAIKGKKKLLKKLNQKEENTRLI